MAERSCRRTGDSPWHRTSPAAATPARVTPPESVSYCLMGSKWVRITSGASKPDALPARAYCSRHGHGGELVLRSDSGGYKLGESGAMAHTWSSSLTVSTGTRPRGWRSGARVRWQGMDGGWPLFHFSTTPGWISYFYFSLQKPR